MTRLKEAPGVARLRADEGRARPAADTLAIVQGESFMSEAELEEAEAVIRAGSDTYVTVGRALIAIRDGKGYRLRGFETFEAYMDRVWDIRRRWGYRLMSAAQVIEESFVPSMAQNGALPTVRQADILAALPVEKRAPIIEQGALELPTRELASMVRAARSELTERRDREQPKLPRPHTEATPAALGRPARVTLLVGDVRAALATLDAESVQTVPTSVPYWGLRSYGTVAQVWGQTCCEHSHEWGDTVRAPWANDVPGPSTNHPKNGDASHWRTKESGQFCAHVHEWQAIVKPAANGIINGGMQGKTLSGESGTRAPSTSGICGCGAWYGEIGLEPTPDLYVEHIVEVFRHVRRVLRKDGTVWLNCGFSYAGSGKGPTGWSGTGDQEQRQGFKNSGFNERWGGAAGARKQEHRQPARPAVDAYKPKDLIPIPFLVAMALQADGWYLRSIIAWCKKAPMPESVDDRPTSAWEPILMLSKSSRYFYDKEAVMESTGGSDTHSRGNGSSPKMVAPGLGIKQNGSFSAATNGMVESRNMRNVWLLGPEPFPGAHFAVFPTEVPRRCILAGSRPGDVVLDPFGGAGTTSMVAARLGRDSVYVDLKPEYAAMARDRIQADGGFTVNVELREVPG